jgi:uncharacterized protein (TIGR03435 family)
MNGRGLMMAHLATALPDMVHRIVVDRTGLEGYFDLDLEWTPFQTPPAAAAAGANDPPASDRPSIFAALQEQLGLKLESTSGPVEVLVIDHVEQPTPN